MAVDRFAAQQGQTVRLEITFSIGGTVADPFEIRQAEIRNGSDQVVATFGGSAIVRETVGQYYVDWPIPQAEPLEIHFDKWYATGSEGGSEEVFTFNFLVLGFSTTTPGAAYMTLAEARDYLPSDTGITDNQLMMQVALVQEIIETKTGRHFPPGHRGSALQRDRFAGASDPPSDPPRLRGAGPFLSARVRRRFERSVDRRMQHPDRSIGRHARAR